MAKNELRHLTVRIDDKTLDKLHYVADYEGRSANSQILILIRDCIEKYEAKHGEIKTGKRD
ncbi:MAG: Arc family DNA-binding protein [Ruminococcaceae bacterium]|nr:Arc family DNA-binding protein [Oscillospiraceae bacterium]